MTKCPRCGAQAVIERTSQRDGLEIWCSHCGPRPFRSLDPAREAAMREEQADMKRRRG